MTNYSTAVFLINKDVRAVLGTYEAGDKAPRELFKTFDPAVKVGDFAVVPTDTRHGMTVVKIVEVDVDFDIENTGNCRWIIDVVDQAAHQQTLAQENAAIQAIKSAELRKKRDEMRKALIADPEALAGLEIASSGPALPPPSQPVKA